MVSYYRSHPRLGFPLLSAIRYAGPRQVMRPGGVIALTLQPRSRGATAADTQAAGERMATSLRAAGFGDVRTESQEVEG
jgi:hypothetical protein